MLKAAIKCASLLFLRLDEAAVSLQKEKNIYKEIENYPTCFKVMKCIEYALNWNRPFSP